MIFIGPHVFEFYEGKMHNLRLRCIHEGEMGPYRTDEMGRNGFTLSPAVFSAYRETVLADLLYVTGKVFNENYFVSDKTMESLESLAKAYEFPTIVAWFERYWLSLEQIAFANDLRAEARLRPNTEHENMKLIAEFKTEIELSDMGPEVRTARISYLTEQNANLSSQITELERHFNSMEDRDIDSMWIEMSKEFSGYEKLVTQYRSNKMTISFLQGTFDNKKTIITDDMIALAKKVPFDKLLKMEQVGGRKRALCPFHNEKTASFYVYPDTNRGYCHGCGRSADTIQYLVEIKKMEFNQAVLMLLNY